MLGHQIRHSLYLIFALAESNWNLLPFVASTNVFVSNGQGISISGPSTVCINGNCHTQNGQTCINGKCIVTNRPLKFFQKSNCPVVLCDVSCDGFYINTDHCPICKCDGYATRGLCDSVVDCTNVSANAVAQCIDSICRLPAITVPLPRACSFAFECSPEQNCADSVCTIDNSGRTHAQDVSCIYDFQCPSGYTCEAMTCWQGGSAHVAGVSCTYDFQCPSNYRCRNMSCYAGGGEHGNFACMFNQQCGQGMVCQEMTCRPNFG